MSSSNVVDAVIVKLGCGRMITILHKYYTTAKYQILTIPRGAINHNKGTDRKRDGQTLTRIRGSKRGLPAIWSIHGHLLLLRTVQMG